MQGQLWAFVYPAIRSLFGFSVPAFRSECSNEIERTLTSCRSTRSWMSLDRDDRQESKTSRNN